MEQILDIHCHIFPPKIIARRDEYLHMDQAFYKLHVDPRARLITAEELLCEMDRLQISKAVVFGFPWSKEDIYRLHNDYVLEMVSRYKDRLLGFCCFLPGSDTVVKEAERCLDGGMVGVGELAWYGSDIDTEVISRIRPLMDLCKERGLPIMFHTNEPIGHSYPGKAPITISGIHNLVKTYQGNKIILAHWGGGIFFYYLLKKEVRDFYEDVYFDTAASPYLYNPLVYRIAISIMGAKRIVFGSDYPLISPKRYLDEMGSMGLNGEERARILWHNALSLINLRG